MGAYAPEARALYGILPDAEQSSPGPRDLPRTVDECALRESTARRESERGGDARNERYNRLAPLRGGIAVRAGTRIERD